MKKHEVTVLWVRSCKMAGTHFEPYTHTQTCRAVGQGDSSSSEPAVTCRSRCSGKPLLTATIDDLIKLSPQRSAAVGGEAAVTWKCVCVCVCIGWGKGEGMKEALCMLTVSPN